jgi:hypothetical protein
VSEHRPDGEAKTGLGSRLRNAPAAAIALAVKYRRILQLVLVAMMLLILTLELTHFVRGRLWRHGQTVMTIYMVPMYLLVLGWLAIMLERPRLLRPLPLCVDLVAIFLGATRMFTLAIPASGHAVLLVYSILVTPHRTYRLIACGYLVITVAINMLLWSSYISPVVGAAVGVVLWYVRSRAMGASADSRADAA